MARILIRTKGYNVINMVIHVNINGSMFSVKRIEEWCGPMSWNGLSRANDNGAGENGTESNSGSDSDDGLPLFSAEDGDGYWSASENGNGNEEPPNLNDAVIPNATHVVLEDGNNN